MALGKTYYCELKNFENHRFNLGKGTEMEGEKDSGREIN